MAGLTVRRERRPDYPGCGHNTVAVGETATTAGPAHLSPSPPPRTHRLSSVMTEAAALLRRARAQSGLSQRSVALAAGVSQPFISRVEGGREEPSLPTLRKLLRACGYTLRLDLEPVPDPHDLGLIETSLRLTPQQRIDRLVTLHRTAQKLRQAMQDTGGDDR